MKSYNIDTKLLDKDLIHEAVVKVCKGKKKKNGKVTAKYRKARKILENPAPYEEAVFKAIEEFGKKQHAIHKGTYSSGDFPEAFSPSKYKTFEIICDNGKLRKITTPSSLMDQFIHQLMVLAASEVLVPEMNPFSCGSIAGRGTHLAAKHIKKYIKRCNYCDKSGIKYAAQLDVRKCFPHVPHEKLKAELRKKFRGHLFLDLAETIIDSYCDAETEEGKTGLPIGFVTSPLFCNFYLTPIDRLITQKMGGKCYTRYVDDMLFFGRNKKQMHRAVEAARRECALKGMPIKDNWQIYRFSYGEKKGRAVDMLGFCFYRDKTALRKNKALKIRRQAKKLGKAKKIQTKDARSFISRTGNLRHCDSRCFWVKNIKPRVNMKKVKEAAR